MTNGASLVAYRRGAGSSTLSLGILAALCACSKPGCVNRADIGLPSPDGTRIAYVFHRSCAGSPVTTQVSIIALPDSLRDDTGNVLSVPGKQPVKIAWRSPTTLRVTAFTGATYEVDHPLGPVTVDFP